MNYGNNMKVYLAKRSAWLSKEAKETVGAIAVSALLLAAGWPMAYLYFSIFN